MRWLAALISVCVVSMFASQASALPAWYWDWAKWRAGHSQYRCHAGDPEYRPSAAPRVIPGWAWDRLRGQRLRPGVCPEDRGTPQPQPQQPPPPGLTQAQGALRDAINQIRAEHGAPALKTDGSLVRAAMDHTENMVSFQYFAHSWNDGTPFSTWISRYWRCSAGEILAWSSVDYTSPSQPVGQWLNSPPHREAMLSRGAWVWMGVEMMGGYATVIFGGAC